MTATPTRLRRGTRVAAALAAVVTLTACGVPTEGDVRVIETQNVPYGLLRDREHSTAGSPPVATEPGEIRGQIALIGGDGVMRLVERHAVTGAPTTIAGSLLQELQTGPTDAERRKGLDSAVSAGMSMQVTGWRRGVLTVDVSGEANPAPDRLPLAVAQIVLTVTSVPAVRAVLFEHDETTVQVPLVNGSLTSAPLTRQDYQHLFRPAASPTAGG